MVKKTIKEMIEVMEGFDKGEVIEFSEDGFKTILGEANKKDDSDLGWNWEDFDYRIKKFQYPMWFKSISSGLVVKFDNLNSGEVIVGNEVHKIKDYNDAWIEHTNKYHWEEIEEPIAKQKVTIEKWLIEDNNIKVVVETSDIDSWLKSFPIAQKLKFIESYEVEI